MDQNNLLRKVQQLGFTLVETNLYLDAYKDDEDALKYFYEMRDEYRKAVQEYEKICGPLTIDGNQGDSWDWVRTPWPWELGVN